MESSVKRFEKLTAQLQNMLNGCENIMNYNV